MTAAAFALGGAWDAIVDADGRAWLRRLVIAGTLGLTALLALSSRPLLLPLEIMLAAAGFLALLRYPILALGVLIAASIFVPFGLSTGSQTSVNVSVLLVSLFSVLWLIDSLLRRELRFARSRTILPLGATAIVACIAFLNGTQPWLVFARTAPITAQLGGLAIVLLSVCAYLLMAHRVRSERALSGLTWLFLILAAVCAIDRFGGLHIRGLTSSYSALAAESMFWLWMVILAFSQAMFNTHLPMPVRVLLVALVAWYMSGAIFLNRDWNSGWMPEVVAIVAIMWIGGPRRAIVASVAAGVLLVPKLQGIVNALYGSNDKNQYDVVTRTAAAQIVAEIAKLDPLFGVGFANYYHYSPLYHILGYEVQFSSHNNYLDILAQMGVIGAACLAWFTCEFAWTAWKLRARASEGFNRAFVCGLLGAVPAMLLAASMGDWVIPFVYNIGMAGFRASVLAWLFMGGLVVIEQLTPQAND